MVAKESKQVGGKGTKKLKDKWRAKVSYKIIAPPMFDSVVLGNTISDAPEKVINRIISASAQDITGDLSKAHIKLNFKVISQKGNNMHTAFYGMTLTSDYLRRLTRRKRSKIDLSVKVTTVDGAILKIKLLSISERRLQTTVKALLRNRMSSATTEYASKKNFVELINYIFSGELVKDVVVACKPIYIIKKLEVRMVEVLSLPTNISSSDEGKAPATPDEDDKNKVAPIEEVKEGQ